MTVTPSQQITTDSFPRHGEVRYPDTHTWTLDDESLAKRRQK
jgi:hypothetical protein